MHHLQNEFNALGSSTYDLVSSISLEKHLFIRKKEFRDSIIEL
jgi:hypothetical protein